MNKKVESRFSYQVKLRRLPMGEGTVGDFVLAAREHDAKLYRQDLQRKGRIKGAKASGLKRRKLIRGKAYEERVREIGGAPMVAQVKRLGREEVEREIKQRQHPLSFDVLTRFEIRHRMEAGEPVHKIAKDMGTSTGVIRQIGKMDDTLPKGREKEIVEHFYRLSGVLQKILSSVKDEEIEGASLGLKLKGADTLMSQMSSIRKGLDGEAPKRIQMESQHETILKYGGREGVINAIRQSYERLKPFMEADVVEVKDAPKQLEGPKLLEQIDMFEGTKEKVG